MYIQLERVLHKSFNVSERFSRMLFYMYSVEMYLTSKVYGIMSFLQVCEAFRLKRETFYLTVDFIDRYLSRVRDVSKPQLQLIGITALFIATKVEVRGI